MYNINKGENTLEESEVLEGLHRNLREVLDLERKGSMKHTEYTDSDVVAAALMYAHVLGNRMGLMLVDERTSIGLAQHLADSFALQVQVLTKQVANVDINAVYKKGE